MLTSNRGDFEATATLVSERGGVGFPEELRDAVAVLRAQAGGR